MQFECNIFARGTEYDRKKKYLEGTPYVVEGKNEGCSEREMPKALAHFLAHILSPYHIFFLRLHRLPRMTVSWLVSMLQFDLGIGFSFSVFCLLDKLHDWRRYLGRERWKLRRAI